MPIDKEKSSAYLQYKRNMNNITYSRITETTGIPNATLSAYFNGSVKSPNKETFDRLMLAVGGSWAEYDAWAPEVNTQTEEMDGMKLQEIIEQFRQAYETNTARMEIAYNTSIAKLEAAHEKEITRRDKADTAHRIEKYVLFLLLVCFAAYALFAFTHYDLPDPTSGLTSLF